MHFSLKQLQHLVQLAEERNFARAASKVKLSQSAFSRSIQILETSVGMRLFDRGLKYVHPTDVGQLMVNRARKLLAETGELRHELELLRSGELGDISLGAGALAGAAVLPGPLARLHQAHPAVLVDVEVIESPLILQKLLRSGLEFFVGEFSEIPQNEGIHIEVLGKMNARFFCRAGHPLAARETIRLDEIANYRLASVHIPKNVMKTVVDCLRAAKSTATEMPLQSGSLTILRDYALRSDVIILGTEGPFRVEVQHGLLVPLRVLDFDNFEVNDVISADIGLISMAERTLSPASELLMNLIRDEAQLTLAPVERSINLPVNSKS